MEPATFQSRCKAKSMCRAKCLVKGCNSRYSEDLDIRFHKLPAPYAGIIDVVDHFGNISRMDKLEAWKRSLHLDTVTNGMRVCSRHFRKDDYAHTVDQAVRIRLKLNAVPSCNLPNKIEKNYKAETARLSRRVRRNISNFQRQEEMKRNRILAENSGSNFESSSFVNNVDAASRDMRASLTDFKMGKTNAENCKNYRNRKKAAKEAEKARQGLSVNKPKRKTGAERIRAYRLRQKMLSQVDESSVVAILSTPSTSSSRIRTFASSFRLATISARTNQPDDSTLPSTGIADHDGDNLNDSFLSASTHDNRNFIVVQDTVQSDKLQSHSSKIQFSSDFCFLCLLIQTHLKNGNFEECDKIKVEDKLKFFVPENILLKIELYTCSGCLFDLNKHYLFRNKCIDNITTLNKYIENTILIKGPSNCSSITLNDLLSYKNLENTKNSNAVQQFDRGIKSHTFESTYWDKNEIETNIDGTKVETIYIKQEIDEDMMINEDTNPLFDDDLGEKEDDNFYSKYGDAGESGKLQRKLFKMDFSSDFCFLCLEYHINLKYLEFEEYDGIKLDDKLRCFLPENVLRRSEFLKYICNECSEQLNNVYSFKQKCVENLTTLNEYLEQSVSTDGSSNSLTVTLPNILHFKKLNMVSNNEMNIESLNVVPQHDIEIKCEPIETTENEFENSYETKIEHVLIKQEINEELIIKDETRLPLEDESIEQQKDVLDVSDKCGLAMPNCGMKTDKKDEIRKYSSKTGKPWPKSATTRSKEFRARQKLLRATSSEIKKPPKSAAERGKEFRARQKLLRASSQIKKPPKSPAERSKEYRARLKATSTRLKKSTERVREFRKRNKKERNKPPPKTGAERSRAYRERLSLLQAAVINKNRNSDDEQVHGYQA